LYQCYSTPYLDKSWFNLNPQNGQLHLLRGLNRDLSEMPIYYLPVSGKNSIFNDDESVFRKIDSINFIVRLYNLIYFNFIF
jgi:hypothetical protein